MKTAVRRVLLMSALMSPSALYALGLGEIRLNSALNQPFDAEIELVSAASGGLGGPAGRAGLERHLPALRPRQAGVPFRFHLPRRPAGRARRAQGHLAAAGDRAVRHAAGRSQLAARPAAARIHRAARPAGLRPGARGRRGPGGRTARDDCGSGVAARGTAPAPARGPGPGDPRPSRAVRTAARGRARQHLSRAPERHAVAASRAPRVPVHAPGRQPRHGRDLPGEPAARSAATSTCCAPAASCAIPRAATWRPFPPSAAADEVARQYQPCGSEGAAAAGARLPRRRPPAARDAGAGQRRAVDGDRCAGGSRGCRPSARPAGRACSSSKRNSPRRAGCSRCATPSSRRCRAAAPGRAGAGRGRGARSGAAAAPAAETPCRRSAGAAPAAAPSRARSRNRSPSAEARPPPAAEPYRRCSTACCDYWWVLLGLLLAALGIVRCPAQAAAVRLSRGRASRRRWAGAATTCGPRADRRGRSTEADILVEEREPAEPAACRCAAAAAAECAGAVAQARCTIEDTLSGEGPVSIEAGDPLAEADFHMAYGLYDQAADLVQVASKREPQRRDLKLKLLEIFFVWGNRDRFLEARARDERDRAARRSRASGTRS